jgi:preprotein translocase subunit SecA
MAGRGTDIILEDGVSELGGLKVIGTERHESRRIDNQLRGRSGRQGDPGVSRFYISLEDDLMRLFGSDRIIKVVDAMGLEDDDPIEHSMLTKAIENAQKKVEANNFAVRKHLLDFDQVMNEQREIIYKERMKVLLGENLKDEILEMLKSMLEYTVNIYCLTDKYSDTWDIKGINDNLNVIYHSQAVVQDEDMQDMLTKDSLLNILYEKAVEVYAIREAEITSDRLREIERSILLRVIDSKWTDHIDDIDQMRQGINLRAYAQKDPLLEYKFISFGMFEELTRNIQHETVKILFNLTILTEAERRTSVMGDAASALDPGVKRQPKVNSGDKVGRNDPCPCGSGKKYKNCCGKNLS